MHTLSIALSIMAFTVIGCSSTYKADRPQGAAPPRLVRGESSIYVSVPEDGSYAGQMGKGSGVATAQAIVAAFAPFALRAERGAVHETKEGALDSAASGNFTHYIEPTIFNWEERATEWSGKPDRISVRLVMYEVSSRTQVDTLVIDGKSKISSWGGDHPQDLLPEPMARYAAEVFGSTRE